MDHTLRNNLAFNRLGSGKDTVPAPRKAGIPITRPHRLVKDADGNIVTPLRSRGNRLFKRFFDLAFSTAVLLTIFPVMLLIIGILIKLESRGPIFFRQARTGLENETFRMFKFRSMTVNRESGTKQAVKGDARITRIGAFLRRTSLDEFPQFINVWLGQMSVVGPRPHMLKHTEIYHEEIPTYLHRHAVKPGVTGLAQVKGWRGPTDELWKMEGRVKQDLRYIQNWSPILDCKCIVQTVRNAVGIEENAF